MQKIVLNYNEFILENNMNTEYDYKKINDNSKYKTYAVIYKEYNIEVEFGKILKNYWERTFTINDKFKLDNKMPQGDRLKIVSIVTYLTKVFILEYKPNILYIQHFNESGLSSERRMKLHKLYLTKLIGGLNDSYFIKTYNYNKNDYITVIYKNESELDDLIEIKESENN